MVEVIHCNCTSIPCYTSTTTERVLHRNLVSHPLQLCKVSITTDQIWYWENPPLWLCVSSTARLRVLHCCYSSLPLLLHSSTTNIPRPRVRRHFCTNPSPYLRESILIFAVFGFAQFRCCFRASRSPVFWMIREINSTSIKWMMRFNFFSQQSYAKSPPSS